MTYRDTARAFAANHALHVSDTARTLSEEIKRYEWSDGPQTMEGARVATAARALLAAIGEGE